MAVKLNQVVPFGRSLAEYRRMFLLDEADLARKILGVADGPASFNAELTNLGGAITSIDPLYAFTGDAIQEQFDRVVDSIIEQVRSTPEDWNWSFHQSPDRLRELRVQTLRLFLSDYAVGKKQGRYRIGSLPQLPIADRAFDLALCSHFLFLYSDHLSFDFHRLSLQEMLRVAQEVRIFPLLKLDLTYSPYVTDLITAFTDQGYQVTIERVDYELQKGGNAMMRLRSVNP